MKYPEMVKYFVEKYNPRKESILDYVTRKKSHHEQFLKKRGWSQEEIDAVWAEITRSLARKKWEVEPEKARGLPLGMRHRRQLVWGFSVKFYSKPKPCGKVIAELKPLNRIGKESK